ncbi:MAG: phage tail tape measure protein [Deltaproteobacteria bacterium]|nr:MAG: phage tail tape measure protein [Deltaproteobacteria bacterium]
MAQAIERLYKLTVDASKATRELKKINKSMGAVGAIAKRAGILIGASFSVSAFKNAIAFGDALAKTADKVGLSVESLQELRFAAEQSGVNVRTLDMAMQRFSRRVGEAADGTGELVKTFAKLGIETRDADGNIKDINDLLNEFAEAIGAVESPTEQLALAFKAFDSEGAALINMLRDGTEGLDELREAARDAGIVMDEETARSAEILQNRISMLTQQIKTQFTTVLIAAGEAVAKLFGTFTDENELLNEIESVEQKLFDVRKAIEVEEARTSTVWGYFGEPDQIAAMYIELDALTSSLESLNAQKSAFAKPEASGGGTTIVDELQEIEVSAKRAGESLVDMQNKIIDLQFPEIKVTARMMDDVESFGKSVTTLLEELKTATDGFVSDFTDSIVDGLLEGELAFEDFAKSVLATLAKLFLNRIFSQFVNSIPMFSGASAGASSLGVSVQATGDSGSAVGVLQPPSYGFAGGMSAATNGYGQITINNNAPVDVEVKQNATGQGMDLDIWIESKVNKAMSGGGLDNAMRSNFGIGRRAF